MGKEIVTDVIGSFGRWQKCILAVVFYIAIPSMWQNLNISFLAPNVPFHCVNSTSQCLVKEGNVSWPCTEWEYDTSFYPETIISKWNLVCDREWLISLTKSSYMIGFLLAGIVFGQLSDWIGRFPVMVIGYCITMVSMFLALFSSSYWMFTILRLFQAFGRIGYSTTSYVLLMESIGEKHRTNVGLGVQLAWSLGFILLPGVAFLVRDMLYLQLVVFIAFVPVAFTFKIMPESPRWLLMKGKKKKLENLLKKAAKMNGKELKISNLNLDLYQSNREEKPKSVLDLFKTPRLRRYELCMIYLWMVNAFMYYGLSYNTNDLAGNPYITFCISGAMEVPSYILLIWAVERIGRRLTLLWFMIGAGISCGAIAISPDSLPWMATTLAMIGKFCVTASFGLLYLYTGEVFPTVVRNVAIGSNSMWGRVGSIIAPFVKELGKATYPWLPNVVYGVLAISSGLLALLLPETKGRRLPDTLEEGEHFEKNEDLPEKSYSLLPRNSS